MEKWQVYVQEAMTQAEFAKRSYAAFRDAESREAIVDIFFHLHHFVAHATSIDRILAPQPGTSRAEVLAGRIDLSGVDFKPFRRLRNHLEHFDERLDRWVAEYDGHAFFDMNVVTGTRGFPRKAFLRALDGDVFKFHGEDYNMQELYAAILEIERRLTSASS
jgi:hypothetical protein